MTRSVTPGLINAWAPFGLQITTPRLQLCLPTEVEMAEMAHSVATIGIHSPDFYPFTHPWSHEPAEVLIPRFLQHHWKMRAEWKPEVWSLELAVFVDGKPIGCQGAGGKDFAFARAAITGSWLLQNWQGQGIGVEMRRAFLHFAFEYLGASEMYSGGYEDNGPSLGVSKKIGYRENGSKIVKRGKDGSGRLVRLVITREEWERQRRDDIQVEGFDACRHMFGI